MVGEKYDHILSVLFITKTNRMNIHGQCSSGKHGQLLQLYEAATVTEEYKKPLFCL